MIWDRFFFEIPIYRISHEAFDQKYRLDLERYWNSFNQASGLSRSEVSEEFRMSTEQHFWEIYGGPWRFNQAVGWLRLFARGSQVRGELWMSAAKHLNRRALREFRLLGKVFELQCWPEQESNEIHSEITAELAKFGKEFRGGKLILDFECFDTMAAYVDWRRLLGFKPPSKPRSQKVDVAPINTKRGPQKSAVSALTSVPLAATNSGKSTES